MIKQRLTGPPVTRATDAQASVLDQQSRRVRLSFSSETPYLRSSFFSEPWVEILGHADGEVDLSRIASGSAPFLWGHDSFDRENNIGVVEKAWIENNRGYADVRLSSREDLISLVQDIADGVLKNVSVGYQILERTLVKQNETGPDEYRVTRWLPLEISLVSVPADNSVGVGRSIENSTQFTIVNLDKDEKMEENTQALEKPATQERQVAPAVLTEADVKRAADMATENAIKIERTRVGEINELVRKIGLEDSFAQECIAAGNSIETVRAKAIDKLASKDITHNAKVTLGKDEIDKQRDAVESWLLHKGGESVDMQKLNGNDYRGMSLLDMARDRLQNAGVSVRGLTNTELATRAISHSTSDFPIILQNVMHKTLQASYTNTPDVWRQFCKVGSLSDFRPHYRYRMGSFGNLAEVKENGTFTYGTFSDAERESISGKTKGKLLNISRQMIINDDLGAFLDMTRIMGRGAARTVEDDVFALLASNPTMGDTGALFNATAVTTAGGHANLNTSGAAPSVAGFDAARQAMAVQKDVGGNDYISVRPTIWLGPVALSGQARVVNEAQYDIDVSNKQNYPNKSRGIVQSIVETPRLSGNIWYFFASPSDEPVIEVGFLNGQQTPYTEMQQGFEVDGVVWKIRLDYGVAAVGYRGAHKVTY